MWLGGDAVVAARDVRGCNRDIIRKLGARRRRLKKRDNSDTRPLVRTGTCMIEARFFETVGT